MGGSGKVRVGVVGAGSWAVSNHIPVLAGRDDVELVSVVRKGAEALQFVQDRFEFAHASEDYREALEQGLDAVVVAGPSALHHEHAKAALEAGANVLCEKPVTIDPADAWDLHETAERLGCHYLISFGWHYGPLGIEAKRLMTEAGGVGDIEHVMVQMASGTRELLKATGAYEGSAAD
ncbi:MAG: Gfo/Idh/MocA family oxidoreductase, partial [bacterium]|nr:Gfo/Idh/MocA family oxidoreductase [bacterium]